MLGAIEPPVAGRLGQAGKDVYVEKPASHNLFEAAQMITAARKYNRMVQVGSQSRSITHKKHAAQLLRDGVIGQVYHAGALLPPPFFHRPHTGRCRSSGSRLGSLSRPGANEAVQ